MATTTPESHPNLIIHVAEKTNSNSPGADIWHALDAAVGAIFPNQLFTIFVYDEATGTTCRLYTTRNDVQLPGARKRVTQSAWSKQVLQDGKQFYGQSIEDIKKSFSEWEFLSTIGCESVLNTPVRNNATGAIVGTLNILGEPHAFDESPAKLAVVLGQLVSGTIESCREDIVSVPFGGKVETVQAHYMAFDAVCMGGIGVPMVYEMILE
ncbi:uncharacterized protein FPRO_05641 [Fusarium proliferatum ET1]|uniref:GAF domain-containing protein n=1 Tax=Fusarium proliferatum (strain ET1) TaxID=1227346 RepID=A0A1L7VEQ7_FUSPR|nr:uncharacterized protein FPRO_05641 [Fusarium proliferatum ET1]CZR39167.1 uncharacterized protein FPRO_05641 [Fusarium proliferatum ET1]